MPTPICSMSELANVVEAALKERLAARPGWSLEPVQMSNRALTYSVRRGDKTVRLLVESARNQGPAAVTGSALRVLAPGPTPDSRLFDELARAVAALDVELTIREAAPSCAPPSGDEKEDVLEGGLLYNPSRHERRFHLINLGLPRTGTTTVAAMFDAWRSAHEFWSTPVAEVLSKRQAGQNSDDEVEAVLRRRETAGQLEVDSTSFLHLAAEPLVRLHPSAAYVLTWRPYESWLDSFLGLLARQARDRKPAEPWPTWEQQMASLILGDFDRTWFASNGALEPVLPQIATAALDFWLDAMTRSLAVLPAHALILPMSQLSHAGPALARLVGVAPSEVRPKHLNARPRDEARDRWFARLPAALKARAAEQTAPLVARLSAAHDTLATQ
jgi:hypothetical protein